MDLRPFEPGDVEEAARLLAARGRRDLTAQPLLDASVADATWCARAVAAAWERGARGVVGIADGVVQAYLLADVGDDDRGRHVWSDLQMHAYDLRAGVELMHLLYAEAARGWVADGRGHHYVVVPAADPREVDGWLRLAFCHEQVHGIRRTGDLAPVPGVHVRRGRSSDVEAMRPLLGLIAQAQRGAPTFAFVAPQFDEGLADAYAQLLVDPEYQVWLGELAGALAGFAVTRAVGGAGFGATQPTGAIELAVAATAKRFRARGVQSALVAAALTWAAQEGYRICVADWRTANLESSRFWPGRGFQPVAYRLHRVLDPRILGLP